MATRTFLLGVVFCAVAGAAGCASTASGEQRLTIVKPAEPNLKTAGVPPDKEAEIQLLLQQREPSARKCYQDVLNEKHDRAFQGTVSVLITIEPSGKPSKVKSLGGTLGDKGVEDCLIATIKDFEFPTLAQTGEVQYRYMFRPAY